MAWTASVLSTKKDPGLVTVTVRFTDGAKVIDKTYNANGIPDTDWIRNAVTFELKALNAQDSFDAPPGPVTPIPDETPDTSWNNFRQRVNRLERIWNQLVITEVIPKNNAQLIALQNSIKADLATYLDRL